MAKLIKTLAATLLALTLALGLIACEAAPSKKSFEKAYEKRIDAVTKGIDNYYALADQYDYQNINVDANIGLSLSDDLLSLLRSYTSYDLDWTKDLTINLSENFNGDKMAVALGLDYSKTDLIALELIMDIAGEKAFVGVPLLSDIFMTTDLSSEADLGSLEAMKDFSMEEVLPSQKQLTSLIKKIYSTFMENIGEVTFEEETLAANGVEQACVAYEVTLTQKDVAEITINILEMLKTDEDFKTVVYDLSESSPYLTYSMDGEEAGYTPDEAYNEAISSIDELLTDLKTNEELSDETALVWTSYITSKLDVIGAKFELIDEYDDSMTLYMASAQNKNDVGVEAYCRENGVTHIGLEGDLVNDGKTLSGTYELTIEDESIAFLDLENIDVKNLNKGLFTGSVSIAPSKGLIDSITDDSEVDLSFVGLTLANLSLKIDVAKNDGKETEMSISLMNGSEAYLSITMDGVISDSKPITIPEKTTEDADEWVTSLDLDKLVEKAKESGLPEYVVELIGMLKMFQ